MTLIPRYSVSYDASQPSPIVFIYIWCFSSLQINSNPNGAIALVSLASTLRMSLTFRKACKIICFSPFPKSIPTSRRPLNVITIIPPMTKLNKNKDMQHSCRITPTVSNEQDNLLCTLLCDQEHARCNARNKFTSVSSKLLR